MERLFPIFVSHIYLSTVVLNPAHVYPAAKTLVFLFTLLHLVFPAFRVLLLVPLFFAFISPRVTYSAVSVNGAEPGPTSTSLLLPPEAGASLSTGLNVSPVDGSKYGTFRSTGSTNLTASGPTTRAHTPDPASRILPLKVGSKHTVWDICSLLFHFSPALRRKKSTSIPRGVSFGPACVASRPTCGPRRVVDCK